MKKKYFAIFMSLLILVVSLTSCVQNDIGVKLNKDGTGSISATLGIEKDFYENMKSMGSNVFDGKDTVEYTYKDKTYIGYTEEKEYKSYEDIEEALLEMRYETEMIEEASASQSHEIDGAEDVYAVESTPTEEKDNHIFSEVDIERSTGIFYSVYTFKAKLNPMSDTEDYQANDTFHVTLSVEMPYDIVQTTGGDVDGNKVSFEIEDVTEAVELGAVAEANNYGLIIALIAIIVIVATVFIIIVKRKKK